MKILLLGAGHIGSTIARWLAATGDYRITVADQNADALVPLQHAGLRTCRLSVDDAAALAGALRGQDALVNALPFFASIAAARAAAAAGVHYFDLTEDVAATQAIAELAHTAHTAFMPQCGLAPGFVGIAAHSLMRGFDRVAQIKMRVGALPQYPNNALKYNLTWSIDGLINEYRHPCEALRDGAPCFLAPMEGLEHVQVDGTDYEAFNTSGGLGSLCHTLAGKVDRLDYKTLRYPGHLALMRFLLHDLELARKPDVLRALLQDAIPTTRQDKVIVFVAVDGWKAGRREQDIFTRTLLSQTWQGEPHSAIQIATTAGLCAAVDLFREGALPSGGFIGQEQVSLDAFLANRFGRAYDGLRPQSAAARTVPEESTAPAL